MNSARMTGNSYVGLHKKSSALNIPFNFKSKFTIIPAWSLGVNFTQNRNLLFSVKFNWSATSFQTFTIAFLFKQNLQLNSFYLIKLTYVRLPLLVSTLYIRNEFKKTNLYLWFLQKWKYFPNESFFMFKNVEKCRLSLMASDNYHEEKFISGTEH